MPWREEHSCRIRITGDSDGLVLPDTPRNIQTYSVPALRIKEDWFPVLRNEPDYLQLRCTATLYLFPTPKLGGSNWWLVAVGCVSPLCPPPHVLLERHEPAECVERSVVLGTASLEARFPPSTMTLKRIRCRLTREHMTRGLELTDDAPWFLRGLSPRLTPGAIRISDPRAIELWLPF